MTSPSTFLSLLRRAIRWLAWLIAAGVVLFTGIAAVAYFWFLPHIANYRDTLAGLMSRALGQRVTLEAVSGSWQQMRPDIALVGVRLHDRQNRPSLYLERLDASFAWRSLLFLEPRFTRLTLANPVLTIRRALDGNIYVGGVVVNPHAADSAFSDWLLKQGTVHISGATLAWQDEVRNAPPLVLRKVDFLLQNRFHHHRIQLSATPPRELATPLTLSADLRGRSLSDFAAWSGSLSGSAAGVALPQLAHWIALPYALTHGWGAATATLKLDLGAISGVAVALNARELSMQLGDGLTALTLQHLRGNLNWSRHGGRQQLDLTRMEFGLPGKAVLPVFDLGVGWGGTTHDLTARNLDLAGLADLLPALPLPQSLRHTLAAAQPGGRIDELSLRWQGERPGDGAFKLSTRFSGLKLAASDSHPGVSNLSGLVRGDERSGAIDLNGSALTLDLPKVFRESRVALDSLLARGGWQQEALGVRFNLDQMDFANADVAASAHGNYVWVRGHAGVADLTAHLTHGNATAVYRYLPLSVGERTLGWVQRGLVAGTSADTTLTLQGNLDRFPFVNDAGGVFKVVIQARDVVLDYVEGWPRIDGINAQVVFHGKRMEIDADQGFIYGARLGPVKALIADLETSDEMLELGGVASGPTQDFIRFANFSPVGVKLDGLTDHMDGDGKIALALNLKIPLQHSADATLGGRLSFLGGSLTPAALPRLRQARGDILFTQNTLHSQGLAAYFLGGPVAISATTQSGHALIRVAGRASAAGLAPWLGAAWNARLSGETAWRGQLVLNGAQSEVQIDSDLVGLESRLPAPLAKSAAQPLALVVTRKPLADATQQFEVQLGQLLGAVWRTTADDQIERGEIRFGGAAQLPQEPGLRLAGNGQGLDFSGWLHMLPTAHNNSGLPVSTIDLGFSTLDLMGRRFPDVQIQGRNRGGLLRMTVSGRDMNGTLTWRPAANGDPASPARLSAQFRRLVIPAATPSAVASTDDATRSSMKAADVPVLDLNVEDFRLEDRALGQLDMQAHGSPQGLVIDKLQLAHPDSVLRMSGVWHDSGAGETQANVQLDIADSGKMLSRFGFKDAVKRGSALVNGDVTWVGTPADFALKNLSGTLMLKARNGQFLKISPGAAKLLGILSLQSLPRRLTFDFRDIFNDGFAYDQISATMRIARGVVYSDDFEMKGPAAKVSMSGLAKLGDETVQLRVKVYPKLSEGVAVAGALLGGPIAGLGVLAAQKLLHDPFESVGSQEYLVTGPWSEPEVNKLSKPSNLPKDGNG
jgi:uncharacterized protein (TIGR02099 family)